MDADSAANIIDKKVSNLLDYYAPLKTVQNRSNCCPALSHNTKEAIRKRNHLRKEVFGLKNLDKLMEYKDQVKVTRNMIYHD